MTEQVALFPLGTVLFPGQLLPLHIFEPRYRQLVADLLSGDHPGPERGFGVIAIRIGRETGVDGVHALHAVGTFATLRAASQHEDGRFDLVTQGDWRFRLRSLDQQSRPYTVADVERLPEPPDDDPEVCRGLADAVSRLHHDYRTSIGLREVPHDASASEEVAGHIDPQRPGAGPDSPGAVAYRVAATTLLTVPDQQALLEAPDDVSRLRAERRLLRRELALWRSLASLPDVGAARTPVGLN